MSATPQTGNSERAGTSSATGPLAASPKPHELTPPVDTAEAYAPPTATPVVGARRGRLEAVDRLSWRRSYRKVIRILDVVAAFVGLTVAYANDLRLRGHDPVTLSTYVVLLATFPIAWVVCVEFNRGYDVRFQANGTFQFERVGRSFLQLTAITTLVVYFSDAPTTRSMIALTLFVTLVISFSVRAVARHEIRRRRRGGSARVPVLAVGSPLEVARFSDTLAANPAAGMFVIGACAPATDHLDAPDTSSLTSRGIPVVGGVDEIREAVDVSGAASVAVVSKDTPGERLRWISWQLERSDVDLIVVPGLTEVAGRRLDIHQVGGLPLVYVAEPELTGVRRAVKATFDRVVAAISLVLLAPVLIAIAVAVRLGSAGPVFFRQTRVGKDGKNFRMIKFRSMRVDADTLIATLQDSNEFAGGTLFKIRSDPRITRFGRVLRRYSLDELPQLFNVLAGSMSLVGPRPPLLAEVATYEGEVHRRLLVKPGMTGLWQISGRSDLSWEESVRLDLRYVDSWSLMLDMVVLVRTVSAVVGGRGAY